MKQTISLFLCVCLFALGTITAQHRIQSSKAPVAVKAKIPSNLAVTGLEIPETGAPVSVPPASGLFADSRIGGTTYDLQSNQLTGNRIHNWGDGKVSAVWCMSTNPLESSGFPDRGTGYNSNATGAFGPEPTVRIESLRTGFPSYYVDATGTEWIVSHASAGAVSGNSKFKIHWAKRAAGATSWTEGDVPFNTPYGGLWARVAVGGPNNNTVHVIYLTTPAGNVNATTPPANATIDGVNGAIRYTRSTDGGATWDIVDAVIPGLDGTNWNSMPADGYSIDCVGNTVAVGVFGFNDDCVLVKSTDNGSTWGTYRVINDFPINKWEFDDGYTLEQALTTYREELAPAPDGVKDTLALLTSDGNGHIMLDPSGKAHVFFPGLYVRDPDTTQDGSLNWYENFNVGIMYWNEDMPDHGGFPVAGWADFDGDGAWGSADGTINIYDGYGFEATSTSPSAGLSADGSIFLTYNSLHELNLDADGIHLFQPLIVRSAPGNYDYWGPPTEVLREDLVADYEITKLTENFFPIMARKVDDYVHMVMQQDFTSGLITRVSGNQDALDNGIIYQQVPELLVEAPTVAVKELRLQDLTVKPNPASQYARVSFNAAKSGAAVIEVFNAMGKLVATQHGDIQSGAVNIDLNTTLWSNGLHYVRVNTGTAAGTVKLMIAR